MTQMTYVFNNVRLFPQAKVFSLVPSPHPSGTLLTRFIKPCTTSSKTIMKNIKGRLHREWGGKHVQLEVWNQVYTEIRQQLWSVPTLRTVRNALWQQIKWNLTNQP
jgi:hypothetical protein